MKNKIMSKVILDLCGGTGAWSKPYKEAGYIVHNITLPDFDILSACPFSGLATNSFEGHKCSGCSLPRMHFSGEYKTLNIDTKDIYGILAAPPCTQFSLARQNAKTPRDFLKGMQVVRKCMDIIWHCRAIGNLKFWALENPRGFLRQFLGKPAYHFQPWQFGDDSKKPTDIWGYFNHPKECPIKKPGYLRKGKDSWAAQFPTPGQKERSITPAGFARAFFEANK